MSFDNVFSNPACTLIAQGASMVGFSNDAQLLQTTSSHLCEALPTETDLVEDDVGFDDIGTGSPKKKSTNGWMSHFPMTSQIKM